MDNGGISMGGNSSVRNAGSFDSHDGNHFVFNGKPGDSPQVVNTDTFNCTGMVTLDPGVAFTNSDTVQITSGTLNIGADYVQDGGSTTIDSGAFLKTGGTATINAGMLYGSGTVNGNLMNAGEVNPGDSSRLGTLTITGTYTQTANGILNIRIKGSNPGTYDQLVINGKASLGGKLNVTLIDNTPPMSGRMFQIVVFANSLWDGSKFTDSLGVDAHFANPPNYDTTGVTLIAL